MKDAKTGLKESNGKVKSALTPAEDGGNAVGNDSSAGGNTPEEKLYNEVAPKIPKGTVTLDDCANYLNNFFRTDPGVNASHWDLIANAFAGLYMRKITSCDSMEKLEKLNFEGYMKYLHLIGTDVYNQLRKVYNSQKSKLNNNNTTSNSDSGRPIPGTNNAPRGGRVVKK